MKVAVAQMEIIPGNPLENEKTMVEYIKRAKNDSVDLIVFPELTIPGYLIGDMWEEESFLRECKKSELNIIELANDLGICVLFGNVSVAHGNQHDGRVKKYNSAIIAGLSRYSRQNGYLQDIYGDYFISKTLLPNYREFDEPRHFSATPSHCKLYPFPIKEDKVGIIICEDGWDDDYDRKVIEELVQAGATFIVNISCSPFTIGKNVRRNTIFSNHAKQNKVPILYVNSVGVQNNGKTIYSFDGSSVLYKKTGEIEYQSEMFVSDYWEFKISAGCIFCNKNENKCRQNQPTDIESIHKALVYSIREYCKANNIENVVIGASGGIDSAVSAALHVEALGAEHVFLVNMPSKFNSFITKNSAQQLALNLQTMYAVVPIEDSVNYTREQINNIIFNDHEKTYTPVVSDFNFENIQARDRSSRILAAIASTLPGGVFSNNGNKTEATVGYCTLYGDVAGYVAPIADLWKEQVYLLGHYINYINEKEIIPKASLEIVASAELSDAQSVDEGKGDPMIYWYHDRLFRAWQQHWNRKTPEDILSFYLKNTLSIELDFPQNMFGIRKEISEIFKTPEDFINDLERWWKLFKGMGASKRAQTPPIIAVSKRAYGFDYRDTLNCCLFTRKYFDLKSKILDS